MPLQIRLKATTAVEMSHQRLDAPAHAPHEPELREHGEDADEEHCHPHGVKERAAVHVCVEDRRYKERPKCHRRDRQRVLMFGQHR